MKNTFSILDPFLRMPYAPKKETLPEGMRDLTDEIARACDQHEALRYAYEALAKKYRGYHLLTLLRLDRFFITDIETLWQKKGFLHCHHMNYLLRTLLVASGQFIQEEIEAHWTTLWFVSPHQYLAVRLKNGAVVTVDLWGKAFGIPFGSYAHGFQAGSIIACEGEC